MSGSKLLNVETKGTNHSHAGGLGDFFLQKAAYHDITFQEIFQYNSFQYIIMCSENIGYLLSTFKFRSQDFV